MTTLLFIAAIAAISYTIALPPERHTLLVVALELPVLAALHLIAVLFVTVVRAVLIAVAVPGHWEASPSSFALQLGPVRPRVALSSRGRTVALVTSVLTILLIALVAAVIVKVALPVARDTLSVGALELTVF